jgi:hypothetical protein
MFAAAVAADRTAWGHAFPEALVLQLEAALA